MPLKNKKLKKLMALGLIRIDGRKWRYHHYNSIELSWRDGESFSLLELASKKLSGIYKVTEYSKGFFTTAVRPKGFKTIGEAVRWVIENVDENEVIQTYIEDRGY